MTKEADARDDIVRWGKSLFDRGLTFGSSGNLSVAIDDGVLITPTNACLGFLDPAGVAKLDAQGRHVAGDAPSKEWPLHQAFFETRANVGAVAHLHSTYATALSCLKDLDADNCLPPLTPYAIMRVGPVKLLDYVRPGDPAMGAMIRALNGAFSAVLLANHGPVVAARTLTEAIYAIEEFEETAKIALLLRDRNARLLTRDQIAELIAVFGAKR